MQSQLIRRVLVVDDNRHSRSEYADLVLNGAKTLSQQAREVRSPIRTEMSVAASGREGLDAMTDANFRQIPFDVLVTDLFMEPFDGLWLIDQVRQRGLHTAGLETVLVSRQDDAALKREEIRSTLEKWSAEGGEEIRVVLRADVLRMLSGYERKQHEDQFLTEVWRGIWSKLDLGKDAEVGRGDRPRVTVGDWQDTFKTRDARLARQVSELLDKYAPSPLAILITGASGTGKELLAHLIHASSGRPGRLVIENMSAVPGGLFESTMFGHVKGAFTGAVANREGLIVRADGGTLFLDEIGELPADQQAKLLRVLEGRMVTPVGGHDAREINFRLIAATNRDLAEEVAANRFRRDLFHRIQGCSIEIPSLEDRPTDIPLLAEYFWRREEHGYPARAESWEPDALAALSARPWDGNVRELQTFIRRTKIWLPPGTRVTREALRLEDAIEPGLERLTTYTQRAQHLRFSPALRRAVREGQNRGDALDKLVEGVAASHGLEWADQPETALAKIKQAWRDHRGTCPSCAAIWQQFENRHRG